MRLIVFLFFLGVNNFVKSQPIQTVYSTEGVDEFSSLCALPDGSFVIVGSVTSSSGFGGSDIYITRISNDKDIIWNKIYGGNYNDAAYAVVYYEGEIIIAASTYSYSNGNNSDVILIRIDMNGNIINQVVYSTTLFDEIPRRIIKSREGYVLCAMSNSRGTTASPDILVFEVDNSGENILWQNLIGSTAFSGDIPSSIIKSSTGGYILAGATKTYATNYDQVIMRLFDDGTIKSHIAFGSNDNENAHDLLELDNEEIVVLGNFRVLSGQGLEMALISISSDNSIKWVKTYGDNGINDDRPYCFKRNINGDYIIGGFSYSYGEGDKDLLVVVTDQEGDMISSSIYGGNGSEQPWDMILNDSRFLIVGSTSENLEASNDCYLIDGNIYETDSCYLVSVTQNSLNINTHNFSYLQNNPNLIPYEIDLNVKSLVLGESYISIDKLLIGKIDIGLNSLVDPEMLGLYYSLYNYRNDSVYTFDFESNPFESFEIALNDDLKISIQTLDLPLTPSSQLMQYRNGFDAFQMEHIVTNKVNAPMQIEATPFVMIAADVDLSDKIRANDITLLQQVIVKKIDGFPQELPEQLDREFIDWRFIDERTVNQTAAFKKAESFPYYSNTGYCRDNVPDIPFFLSNQGSCDESYEEKYLAILLGDLTNGGYGVDTTGFDIGIKSVNLTIDDVHDLGDNTYRVFLNHTLNETDKFVSLDFALDYNEYALSIERVEMTLEDKFVNPQWMYNDYNSEELLFTSYTSHGYPTKGSIAYFDIRKYDGVKPDKNDLNDIHVFVNGLKVPTTTKLKSESVTTLDIANEISEFVTIYPNPAKDQFTVTLPRVYASNIQLELFNAIGQSVLLKDYYNGNHQMEVNVSPLPAGLYHCLIKVEGKSTVVKKILIE